MVPYGSVWFLMVLGFLMVLYGSLWFLLVSYGFSWFLWFILVIYGSLWFLMVPYVARFLIVPYGVLWFLMVSLLFLIGLMGFNCSLVFQLNLPVFVVSFGSLNWRVLSLVFKFGINILLIAKFLASLLFLLTLEEQLSLWYFLILVISDKLYFLNFSGIFWWQLNCSNLFPESS